MRPAVACALNQFLQLKASDPTEKKYRRLGAGFKRLREEQVQLLYGLVELAAEKVDLFFHASFATNIDLSSKLQ